ncbi:hypothetical protein RISK_006409 [Rhodopirellula islandica]|uniref:Uncharacterized protein n=1 Tax=Rhodopirellula islandica TaxID=595434 RepID=A0A0J1B478_RHOIS|nr:hypothetical protein RISK_006409 [Rhodopirellula islandica]
MSLLAKSFAISLQRGGGHLTNLTVFGLMSSQGTQSLQLIPLVPNRTLRTF